MNQTTVEQLNLKTMKTQVPFVPKQKSWDIKDLTSFAYVMWFHNECLPEDINMMFDMYLN